METGLTFMRPVPGVRSTWWLTTVLLPNTMDRRALRAHMAEHDVEVRPLWQPLHLSPALEGAYSTACPVAEDLYRRAVSLPSSTGLSDEGVDRVVDVLRVGLRRLG